MWSRAARKSPRLLIIGIDTGDADLIERWADQGFLRTLATLRRQGTWRRLGTTADVLHFSAWPSIYTGTHPGRHGIYNAFQIRAGEQSIRPTRGADIAVPPFWRHLDRAGRRCIVMDPFCGPPLEAFGGIQILEYGTWKWFSRPMAAPRGIRRSLLARFGRYPAPEAMEVVSFPDPRKLRDQLLAAAAVKSNVVQWLMTEQEWDLFFVTFAETHIGGHYLWHLHDLTYPREGREAAAGLEPALRDVYAAVDRAIGAILERRDDRVTVMIVSGDGMGPNYAVPHLVPDILSGLGLAKIDSGGPPSTGGLSWMLRNRIPERIRGDLKRFVPRKLRDDVHVQGAFANVRWCDTRAFSLPNDCEGFVRLNVKGREPHGVIANRPDRDRLLAELRERLLELKNPVNDQAAVLDVISTEERFPGAECQHLPDAVILWSRDSRVISAVESADLGLIEKAPIYEHGPYYVGNHRPVAFALCRGPGVQEGVRLNEGHIFDIAATSLGALGVDPPRQVEGHPWTV